jgi:phosphopantothenoylcysteine decarboxylase/phosphopantothenate--cysteine ligase
MLKNKTVILGVTGSIAAYKIANLASMLVKQHCDVHVIMTENATNFINPITFETLTSNKCIVDTFDRNFQYNVEHVALAKKASVMMVAPASANVIGKMAGGLADDMLTTTALAMKNKIIVVPAMNTNMYENQIVQDNMDKLRKYGIKIVEPDCGRLACNDIGKGKLPKEEVLFEHILMATLDKDLEGKNILVTAGPTVEAIDPVRYISNHSTGKMGYAIAKKAAYRGANVTLVTGKTSIEKPMFVEVIDVVSAEDMFNVIKDKYKEQDIIIKSAAVADYTPVEYVDSKIKKSGNNLNIELKRTTDILGFLGENKKENQFICGFSMETDNLINNSKNKLQKKNADMIIANSLTEKGAGFGVDTNKVFFITKDKVKDIELMTKENLADIILDEIIDNKF